MLRLRRVIAPGRRSCRAPADFDAHRDERRDDSAAKQGNVRLVGSKFGGITSSHGQDSFDRKGQDRSLFVLILGLLAVIAIALSSMGVRSRDHDRSAPR